MGEEVRNQKARRGRKAMHDSGVAPKDDSALKKERSRIAQRTYRSRRESEVISLKAQVENLQFALQKTTKSFNQFQQMAIKSNTLSPKLSLELSRAGMEIASYSHTANDIKIGGRTDGASYPDQSEVGSLPCERAAAVQPMPGLAVRTTEIGFPATSCDVTVPQRRVQLTSPFISQPSSPIFPWTASQSDLTFTQSFRLACVERGVQLLSDPNINLTTIHPVLSLHLRTMTIKDMRHLAERSLFQKVPPNIPNPSSRMALEHPTIFRTIEGNGSVFEARAYKREPDRLVFGRTRTVVDTWLPGFEGEWLEPVDVKEYLESKNVVALNDEPSSEGRDVAFIRQRLIEYLALHAVCIGLGPAVRKSDVDKALDLCEV
ncbi:hypothetical protein BKA65DRAFT_241086 [Rhexocercosporidium sp. MPI-PUGE-AT-0058]|nr:hypothetical protein BKA65DRAFT_241086 [Rhexocercosporidium sp. MPI-PUGE-AT-0058]